MVVGRRSSCWLELVELVELVVEGGGAGRWGNGTGVGAVLGMCPAGWSWWWGVTESETMFHFVLF